MIREMNISRRTIWCMTTNSEEYRIRRIPDNFENGINFAGFNFKPIFLIEGIVLGIIFFVLAIVIMFACGIRHINSSTIGICLVPCVLAIILGIKGINDDGVIRKISAIEKAILINKPDKSDFGVSGRWFRRVEQVVATCSAGASGVSGTCFWHI